MVEVVKYKKFLPLALVVLGVLILGFFIVKSRGNANEVARELTLAERPFVSLTPTEDGHYLKLLIDRINVSGAATLEYELLYDVPGGVTQGVPSTPIELSGISKIERELLLGSESAGKFRFDEGVQQGVLNIKFRSGSGKQIAKLSTDFTMLENAELAGAVDGDFSYVFDSEPDREGIFFVSMNTFGLPKGTGSEVASGPKGVFASKSGPFPGSVADLSGKVFRYDGTDWREMGDGKSPGIGVFVGVK